MTFTPALPNAFNMQKIAMDVRLLGESEQVVKILGQYSALFPVTFLGHQRWVLSDPHV